MQDLFFRGGMVSGGILSGRSFTSRHFRLICFSLTTRSRKLIIYLHTPTVMKYAETNSFIKRLQNSDNYYNLFIRY